VVAIVVVRHRAARVLTPKATTTLTTTMAATATTPST